MFIFMDESGDLGFNFNNKKTSKYFLITFVFVENKKVLDNAVKKIHRNFTARNKKHHPGTLHCNKELPRVRKKLLSLLAEGNIRVMAIILNKSKVYIKMRNQKHILYNYVTNILLDRIFTKNLHDKNTVIDLIASKRETNRFLNENFKSYIINQMKKNHSINLDVKIKYPSEEKGLQAVDFLSWAIFRKIEHNDPIYYGIIHKVIVEENSLF